MMSLKVQIIALVYSFLFGIFFGGVFNACYSFLFLKRRLICFINTFLFNIFMALLYFFILLFINNGILHIYFLFSFFLGFLLISYLIFKKRK